MPEPKQILNDHKGALMKEKATGNVILGFEDYKDARDTVKIYDWFEIRGYFSWHCDYCGNALSLYEEDKYTILFCKFCGWWKVLFTVGHNGGFGVTDLPSAHGVLKQYDIDSPTTPINLIHRHLIQYPKDIANVNPYNFEKIIASCFKDYYAPCEVIHIGQSHDRGIDLKLIMSDGGTYLVQVKRRKNIHKNESVKFIRELNGVLFREGIPKGIFVTTAKGYTKDAVAETHILTETAIPYDMKLLAFDDLIKMLNISPQEPYKPWTECLKNIPKSRWP